MEQLNFEFGDPHTLLYNATVHLEANLRDKDARSNVSELMTEFRQMLSTHAESQNPSVNKNSEKFKNDAVFFQSIADRVTVVNALIGACRSKPQ